MVVVIFVYFNLFCVTNHNNNNFNFSVSSFCSSSFFLLQQTTTTTTTIYVKLLIFAISGHSNDGIICGIAQRSCDQIAKSSSNCTHPFVIHRASAFHPAVSRSICASTTPQSVGDGSCSFDCWVTLSIASEPQRGEIEREIAAVSVAMMLQALLVCAGDGCSWRALYCHLRLNCFSLSVFWQFSVFCACVPVFLFLFLFLFLSPSLYDDRFFAVCLRRCFCCVSKWMTSWHRLSIRYISQSCRRWQYPPNYQTWHFALVAQRGCGCDCVCVHCWRYYCSPGECANHPMRFLEVAFQAGCGFHFCPTTFQICSHCVCVSLGRLHRAWIVNVSVLLGAAASTYCAEGVQWVASSCVSVDGQEVFCCCWCCCSSQWATRPMAGIPDNPRCALHSGCDSQCDSVHDYDSDSDSDDLYCCRSVLALATAFHFDFDFDFASDPDSDSDPVSVTVTVQHVHSAGAGAGAGTGGGWWSWLRMPFLTTRV